jgi:hypothetical protein
MVKRKDEASARLDDLQQGFGGALSIFPGGEEYRVCFATDEVFVVRELEPGADAGPLWASFCGPIYALAGFLDDMDRQIGNPGLRVVVAAGPLLQVSDPESWKKLPCKLETANWFVLTGAADALRKCMEAESLGKREYRDWNWLRGSRLQQPGAIEPARSSLGNDPLGSVAARKSSLRCAHSDRIGALVQGGLSAAGKKHYD